MHACSLLQFTELLHKPGCSMDAFSYLHVL